MTVACGWWLTVVLGAGAARAQSTAPSPLQLIDSVRIAESDSLMIGRIGRPALAADGRLFIPDIAERRIVEVLPTGRIERTYGRRGRGPGEFELPSAVALGGDTLIAVYDDAQRHVALFDRRNGRFIRNLAINAVRPSMRIDGHELLIAAFDVNDGTSLRRFALDGKELGAEGIIPSVADRTPAIVLSFADQAIATFGNDVYAAFELTQSLFRWKRGSRSATEIRIPVLARRGVPARFFENLLRDPGAAAPRAYDRSIPQLLTFVAPHLLALVTLDGELSKTGFHGNHSLTILDLERRRGCLDVPIAAPTEPLPRIAIRGDTLVVLQQDEDARGEPAAAIRRFRIVPRACRWTPLP